MPELGAVVAEVARSCAVEIHSGKFRGSGFFAQPGLVVTCAHVVGNRETVTVMWGDRTLTGDVEVVRPERPADTYWPFPDLATIRLHAPPEHPVAWLDPAPAGSGDVLVGYGFSLMTPEAGPKPDGLRVVLATSAGRYARIKDDQVVGGLSGSLLVNERTGLVAGVVKASRDQGNAAGGWVIPAAEVTALLSGDVERGWPDGWRHALMTPLRQLFEGQARTSQMLPYRLLDGPRPPLSDVYVQQRALGERPVEVQQALRRAANLVLVGAPGAGKSSLAQHVCAETARWWLKPEGEPPYGLVAPLRIPAAAMVSGTGFTEMVAAAVSAELTGYLDRALPAAMFETPPAPDVTWLVIVDGVDEVLDFDRRTQLLSMLDLRLRQKTEFRRFVVTTRPLGADPQFARLVDAAGVQYDLLPFDRGRIREFAAAWFKVRDPERAPDRTESFLDQVLQPGLVDVVSIPLLTTIAAVVFEEDPTHSLPSNLLGLYDAFLRILLAKRRADDHDHVIRRRLTELGDDGRAVLRELHENTRPTLEKLAYRWFFDSRRMLPDVLREILADKHQRRYDGSAWSDLFRLWLLDTGMVTASGELLSWLHLSLAEYLASRELTRRDPAEWIWLAASPTTTNVARFGLTTALQAGPVRWRTLSCLVRSDSDNLVLAAVVARPELITDRQAVRLGRRALVRNLPIAGLGGEPPPLFVFRRRPACVRSFARALRNPLWGVSVRRRIAEVLLKTDDSSTERQARDTLLAFMRSRRRSAASRVEAARVYRNAGRAERDLARPLIAELLVQGRMNPFRRLSLATAESPELRAAVLRAMYSRRFVTEFTLRHVTSERFREEGFSGELIADYVRRVRLFAGLRLLAAACIVAVAAGVTVLTGPLFVIPILGISVMVVATHDREGLVTTLLDPVAVGRRLYEEARARRADFGSPIRFAGEPVSGADPEKAAFERFLELIGRPDEPGTWLERRWPRVDRARRALASARARASASLAERRKAALNATMSYAAVHHILRIEQSPDPASERRQLDELRGDLTWLGVHYLARKALRRARASPRDSRELLKSVLSDPRVRFVYARRLRATLDILGG